MPKIGQFASADTIVPDPMNPQSFNRYAYVLNNPLKYTDPSGHCELDSSGQQDHSDQDCWQEYFNTYEWLLGQGIENPGELLGAGKDWLLTNSESFLTREGIMLERMDFLLIRQRHFAIVGRYCESVGCIEDDIFGNGELMPAISPEIACGTVALAGLGNPAACGLLDIGSDVGGCFEDGLNSCGTSYFIEESINKTIPGAKSIETLTGLGPGDWISEDPTGMFDSLVSNVGSFIQWIGEIFVPPAYAPNEPQFQRVDDFFEPN